MKKVFSLISMLLASCAIFNFSACSEENVQSDSASAFVIWQKVDGALSYNIGIVEDSKETSYINTSSSANYFEWKNLENEKEYTFSVYATLADGSDTKKSAVTKKVSAYKGRKNLFVMGYFLDAKHDVDEQNLHLAVTSDGLHWQALNNNAAVFKISTIGGNRVRDPYIVKKPDGTYLMIATDWTLYQASSTGGHRLFDGSTSSETSWNYETNSYWDVNTSCLIFADSEDLITWKNERQIQMVSDEDKKAFYDANTSYQFCWAPEIIHDNGKVIFTDPETNETYKYGVIWSGQGETDGKESKSYNPKKGKYEKTSGHATNYRRTFVNYTNDFETFAEPQVYFDPGKSNIDLSVCSDDKGTFYAFYKDECSGYYGMAENYSKSLLPNSFNSNYIWSRSYNNKQIQEIAGGTYNQGEGMFCFRPNAGVDRWICVLDAHDAKKSKVFATYETSDFRVWKENDNTSWPSGEIRHGACVEVSLEEMTKLINAFGF